MKKFIALGSILVLTIIGACTAHADSEKETNQETYKLHHKSNLHYIDKFSPQTK